MTKNKCWLACIFCLISVSVDAKNHRVIAHDLANLAATKQYYSKLISGHQVDIPELTIFTNSLPKGGDLHHHYSGAVYAETYLDWVGLQNYCVYHASNPSLKIEKFKIETKPLEASLDDRPECLSAEDVRKDAIFYRELLSQWSDKDYDNHFTIQTAPDHHFFDTFGYFGAVSNYDYNKGLKALKARAQSENLGYLETMLKGGASIDAPELDALLNTLSVENTTSQTEESLRKAYDFLANNAEVAAKVLEYVKTLEKAASGLDDESFTLRFQSYVSRNSSPAKVFSSLYTSFVAAKRTPLMVGVNIVGSENGYVAMRDYALHMKMFAFLKKQFPDVNVALHAGELAMGMVPPEGLRSHIYEAVQIAGANRIGHGVDIVHESNPHELLQLMKQRAVALEVNLTSNAFILGIKGEEHPIRLYERYGVPIVISTDDAGVSRINLSHEYLLYTSRYKPSYDRLKQVVYNSIRYSFLPEKEKRHELTKLDQRFIAFEANIAQQVRLGYSPR